MVPQEEIERFLHGEDDEKYIVAIEYDYKSDKIFLLVNTAVMGQ